MDDLEQLESFFDNQRELFDEGFYFFQSIGKDIDYFQDQPEILQQINRIRAILHESPGYPSVTDAANSWAADIFVSIHVNAGGGRDMWVPFFSAGRETVMQRVATVEKGPFRVETVIGSVMPRTPTRSMAMFRTSRED